MTKKEAIERIEQLIAEYANKSSLTRGEFQQNTQDMMMFAAISECLKNISDRAWDIVYNQVLLSTEAGD